MTRRERILSRYLELCENANLADDPEDYSQAMAYAFGYLHAIDDALGRDVAQSLVNAASERVVGAPSIRGILPLELAMDGKRSQFVLDLKSEHLQ